MEYVLTAKVGTNADLFPQILKLYTKPSNKIADVTYGRGVFWKHIDTSQYEFHPSDIETGTDMRALPYADGGFDMVIIDPPYVYNPKGTVKESIAKPYALTAQLKTTTDVINLYRRGMIEAHRVLMPNGLMIVKCQDGIESSKQHWNHITIYNIATTELSMYGKDLFVLVQSTRPAMRWKHQIHARKNHSYFWVFQK